jgi:hypothetical protein
MYVQADSSKQMADYLVAVRDMLMSDGIYFSAAVKKGELTPQLQLESREDSPCKIRGASFEGEKIAELYRYQNLFKGIGIRLDEDVVEELRNDEYWNTRIVSSYYVPEVGASYERFFDLSFDVDALKKNEKRAIKSLLMKALCSNSESPRHGRFYVSLLITMMHSYRLKEVVWKNDSLYSAPVLYEVVLNFATNPDKTYDLYGLECLALVLLDILYNNDSLGDDEKRQISRKILDSHIMKAKYEFLGNIPKDVFFDSDVWKLIIEGYQNNVSMEILEKFDGK